MVQKKTYGVSALVIIQGRDCGKQIYEIMVYSLQSGK